MPHMTAPSRVVTLLTMMATLLLLLVVTSEVMSLSRTKLVYPHLQDIYLYTTTSPESPRQDSHGALGERVALAEKLWRQSTQDRQKMLGEVSLGARFPDGYIYPYSIWDFARPSFFCPHDLERVGTLGDGGKVVCGMSQYERLSPGPSSPSNPAPELVVYSFGVSDDSSFEAALLERTNARIWGYDYSVEAWSGEIPEHQRGTRALFKMAGIGKSDPTDDPPMYTVQELMKANGHSYVDIVKMDIEGAEFDALTSLIQAVKAHDGNDAPLPFGQLLIEIHFMGDPPGFHVPKTLQAWMDWWASLEQMGLRPVNNEDNWIGDVQFGRPRFMEYTLINAVDYKRNKLLPH